jgi:DNA repair protein RecO
LHTQSDLAIILKAVVFEERHRVVTALTANHGKVTCIARNSIQSRRFGGTLEPFVASEWVWIDQERRELGRLESATVRRGFDGIRASFEKLTFAAAITEFALRAAPEREPCGELFRLHSNALAAIEEAPQDKPPLSLLNIYLAKLLQWSGNQPQVSGCLSCRRSLLEFDGESLLSWNLAQAAWFCPSCRDQSSAHIYNREGASFAHSLLRISARSATDFLLALDLPIRKALEHVQSSASEERSLFTLLEALVRFHIPGLDQAALKSLRFIREPTNPQPN